MKKERTVKKFEGYYAWICEDKDGFEFIVSHDSPEGNGIIPKASGDFALMDDTEHIVRHYKKDTPDHKFRLVHFSNREVLKEL